MFSPQRVAQRYRQALDDAQALETLTDQWVDTVFDAFDLNLSEGAVEQALRAHGVSADHINEVLGAEGKEAGGLVQALGGTILRSAWSLVLKPFFNIAKYFTSQDFRDGIKRSVKRYLSHEVRASRHMMTVAGRLVRGEPIHPAERKEAVRQFVRILSKAVFLYVSGPQIAHFFTGGIWNLLGVNIPFESILTSLIDKPLEIAAKSLLG